MLRNIFHDASHKRMAHTFIEDSSKFSINPRIFWDDADSCLYSDTESYLDVSDDETDEQKQKSQL